MNGLQNYNFEGNQVPVKLVGEQLMFDAETVAKSVGLTTVAKSGNAVVRWSRVNKYLNSSTTFGAGDFITEQQMYKLAIKANNPTAERFQDWVTGEVLPSIRKNGAYLTDQKAFDVTHNPNALGDLLLQAGEQLKQKDLQITEMKPKALFADAVAVSHSSILIGELAKIMKQNGVNIGQNRLFEWMRVNGYLISGNRSDKNMPTQKSLELGLFKIKETVINHSDGHTTINKTPKVTGKGQQYFINKFLKTA